MRVRYGATMVALLSLLIMTSGCGRMQVANEVRLDGSFTRSLMFKEPVPEAAGEAGDSPAAAMMGSGKPEDYLILPTGPEWKTTRTKRGDEVLVTVSRTVAPGAVLKDDIGIRKYPKENNPTGEAPPADPQTPKPDPNVTVLSNAVRVRELPGNKLEYEEVIRWRGELPKDLSSPDDAVLNDLKKTLPTNLATDEKAVQRVASDIQISIWRMMFGPGEPLLPLLLANPDVAEYKLKGRLRRTLDQSLEEHFGNRLTPQQRIALVAQLADKAGDASIDKTEEASANPPGAGSEDTNGMGAPISLFLRLKMPGKVLSTNGEIDPYTGEVLWSMYSWAAGVGEVTLSAVCEKP